MKGSAAVQGFKALASKIHGQLPLTTKESQRLLTALTTSFRKHLDDVHPVRAPDTVVLQKTDSQLRHGVGNHPFHSSASLADDHVASILAGPLLARKAVSPLNEVTAKLDAGAGPLDLLESYQQKGISDLRIASLCFQAYLRRNAELPIDCRLSQLREDRAGTCALAWLSAADRFKAFLETEDRGLRNCVVSMIMREGLDEVMWEWLQLDIRLEPPNHVKVASSIGSASGKMTEREKMRLYLWKGHLLASMIDESAVAEMQSGSAEPALDLYLHAVDLRSRGRRERSFLAYMPTDNALKPLIAMIKGRPGQAKYTLPPSRYDELFGTLPPMGKHIMRDFDRGMLSLFHPTRPDGRPLHQLIARCYDSDILSQDKSAIFFRENIRRKDSGERPGIFHLYLRAAVLLQMQGEGALASTVLSAAHMEFPEFELEFEHACDRMRAEFASSVAATTSDEGEAATSARAEQYSPRGEESVDLLQQEVGTTSPLLRNEGGTSILSKRPKRLGFTFHGTPGYQMYSTSSRSRESEHDGDSIASMKLAYLEAQGFTLSAIPQVEQVEDSVPGEVDITSVPVGSEHEMSTRT